MNKFFVHVSKIGGKETLKNKRFDCYYLVFDINAEAHK